MREVSATQEAAHAVVQHKPDRECECSWTELSRSSHRCKPNISSSSVPFQLMPATKLGLDACASYFYRGCLFLCVVDGGLGHLTGHKFPDKSRGLAFRRGNLHGGPMPLSLHHNSGAMEQSWTVC